MEFFDSLRQVKSNWQPYKKWETEQNDKEFQRQELHKRIPTSKEDLDKASQYGRTLIDSINIMDQYSINKAEDVEVTSKLASGFIDMAISLPGIVAFIALQKNPKMINLMEKNPIKGQLALILPTIALPLVLQPFFTVKFASYEKEASRIARYQAREDELKDPQKFVIYDNKQIEEAKKIAKTLPDPVEEKKSKLNPITNYSDSIKSIKTLIKDHKNYLNWKQEHLKNEKNRIESVDNMEISNEQMQKAKNDQDNLLRVIRKIELNSQNYLNNTEAAFNLAMGSSALTGLIGGLLIKGIIHILQKVKVISNNSKIINVLKSLAPAIGAIGLVFSVGSYSVKAQKEAAKIGRFKAKQELLKDPHNFISYDDEQLDSVKDLKAPPKEKPTLLAKTKNSFKFFFKLKRDFKEYEKYKKTEGKEEQKLQEALKKINVSNDQIKKAKSLQKNAFMSFEKIDEMTQRYVDDTEAAADITKQFIESASSLIMALGALVLMTKKSKQANKIKKISNIISTIALPLVIQLIATVKINQVKKEAGKIGTMKAMQDLDDPKHFVQDSSMNTES